MRLLAPLTLWLAACVAPLQSVAPEDSVKPRGQEDVRRARIRISVTNPPPICRDVGVVETAAGSFRDPVEAEAEIKEQAIDIGANFLVVGEQGTDRDPVSPRVHLRGRAFDCPAEAFGTTRQP